MKILTQGAHISYEIFRTNNPNSDWIIFLHGWDSNQQVWKSSVEALKSHYNILTLDLPGFGDSSEPATAYSVSDYNSALVSLLDELQIVGNLNFVGHSYGGRMTIKIASNPSILGMTRTLDRIVLVDAAGIKPKRSLAYYLKVYSYKFAKLIYNTWLMRKLAPDAFDIVKANAGSTDYNNATDIMRGTLVKSVNEDLTSWLTSIKVPTLLIWGTNDNATPLTDAKLMEKRIPDAGLVELPGAGHFSFLEQPAIYLAALKSFMGVKNA